MRFDAPGPWAAAVLALVGSSCAQPAPPLGATVMIEESGMTWPVEHVAPAVSIGADRDAVLVLLANGGLIDIDFARPAPLGQPLAVGPDEPLAPARVSFSEALSEGGRLLCSSDARSEGSLVVRAESWRDDGFLGGLDATLRVRLAGCDATFDGVRLGDLTLVVELPGER